MKIQPGDVVVFKGCSWIEPHWEFDKPVVVYSPIKCYGFNDVEVLIEDACCDLAAGLELRNGFSQSDLQEFRWRGWDPKGFSRRKKARHVVMVATFYLDKRGELTFSLDPKT